MRELKWFVEVQTEESVEYYSFGPFVSNRFARIFLSEILLGNTTKDEIDKRLERKPFKPVQQLDINPEHIRNAKLSPIWYTTPD